MAQISLLRGAAAAGVALAAALAATPAGALTELRVGASEFGRFSRVVLDIRPPAGWSARDLERGLEIELPINDLVLNDSAGEVLRRADRVSELASRSGPGGAFVYLRFNCDCVGRAYAVGNRSIVVDVADRGRPETAPAARQSAAEPPVEADLRGGPDALRLDELGHQNRGLGLPDDAAPRPPALRRAEQETDDIYLDSASGSPAGLNPADLDPADLDPYALDLAGSHPADPDAADLDAADLDAADLGANDDEATEVETADIETAQIAVSPDLDPLSDDPEAELRRARDLLMAQLRQAAEEGIIELREDAAGAADLAAPEETTAEDPAAAAPEDQPRAEPPLAPDAPVAADAPFAAPAEPSPSAVTDATAPVAPEQAATAETATPAPAAAEEDVDRVAAATAAAIDAVPVAPSPRVRPRWLTAEACFEDDRLEPARWRVDGPFSETLALRRAGLYDALNRVQPGAVASLTRFYIGVGFYAEAMATPVTYGVDSDETRLLVEIARILDERPASPGGPFAQETLCRGRHAMWQAAALADAEPARAAAAYRRSGRALARTPEPFRRELGARIALAAAAAGDWDTARDIYSLLRRNLDAPSAALRMLRAELALADDRGALARRELSAIAASRDVRAPRALIRLSQILEAPGEADDAAALIDSLTDAAMQHRGSPLEAELVAAGARLAARFGLLGRALSELDAALVRSDARGAEETDRLASLRFDLVAAEIAALGEIERNPAAATSGLVEAEAAPGTNQITPRLRVSAGAIQTVEAVRRMPPDPDSDAMRLALAEHLLRMRAPALAALVVDEAAAARSLDAAILRARAINPIGAGGGGEPAAAPAPAPDPAQTAADMAAQAAAQASAADAARAAEDDRRAQRLERLLGPAPALGSDAPPTPVNDPSRGPGSPITRGEGILRSLEQELELLQEVIVDG